MQRGVQREFARVLRVLTYARREVGLKSVVTLDERFADLT